VPDPKAPNAIISRTNKNGTVTEVSQMLKTGGMVDPF
jgi:hypothetical protein